MTTGTAEALAKALTGLNLEHMAEAFHRVIEAHAHRANPFHQPVNADAMLALRELRGLIPALAALAAQHGSAKPRGAEVWQENLRLLVSAMWDEGLVPTVEQIPLQPLAMGNYRTVVSVRPVRGTQQ